MFENKIPDDFENPPGNLFRSQKGHGRRGRLVTLSTSNMVNACLYTYTCLTPTHVCLVDRVKMSSALVDRSEADKLVLRVRLKMSFHFLWLYFKTYWLTRHVLLHAYTRDVLSNTSRNITIGNGTFSDVRARQAYPRLTYPLERCSFLTY